MCGILYVRRLDNTPAKKQALKRYHKQKERGTDGFGYVVVKQSGTIGKVKRFQFEHELKASLETCEAQQLLLHHRYPTSTPNLPEATHPIKVSHPELQHDYLVVHNGVISNADELKDEHLEMGYKYTTEINTLYRPRQGRKVYHGAPMFNDSEAFAIELVRNIEGKIPEARAKGAIAYCALQVNKQGQALALYYGSNEGNPLTFKRDNHSIVIASEGGDMLESHKHYKLNLRGDIVEDAPEVKLVQERRVGYVPYSGYVHGDRGEFDDLGRRPAKRGRRASGEAPTLWELETELDEVDADLETAREEGLAAMSAGDLEGEDTWKYELKKLEARREIITETLARYAAALHDD